jgi:hypothetical protein
MSQTAYVVRNASGHGEALVVVVQGGYDTEEEALAAVSEASLGHLQGFYIDRADNYNALGRYDRARPSRSLVDCASPPNDHARAGCEQAAGRNRIYALQPASLRLHRGNVATLPSGEWLVLTGFRTKRGAEEFLDMTYAFGIWPLETYQVRKFGDNEIGLGQESHPNGLGPLTEPLRDQEAHQT